MSIEINEKIVGMLAVHWNGEDWLGAISRIDDTTFELKYRFRYYRDNDTTSHSEDIKNWYIGKISNSTAESAMFKLRQMIEVMVAVRGGEITEILMKNGDVDGFMKELMSQPWAHRDHEREAEMAVELQEQKKSAH